MAACFHLNFTDDISFCPLFYDSHIRICLIPWQTHLNAKCASQNKYSFTFIIAGLHRFRNASLNIMKPFIHAGLRLLDIC